MQKKSLMAQPSQEEQKVSFKKNLLSFSKQMRDEKRKAQILSKRQFKEKPTFEQLQKVPHTELEECLSLFSFEKSDFVRVQEVYLALKSQKISISAQAVWFQFLIEFAQEVKEIDLNFYSDCLQDMLKFSDQLTEAENPDFEDLLDKLQEKIVTLLHILVQQKAGLKDEALFGDVSALNLLFKASGEQNEEALQTLIEMAIHSEKTVDWLCLVEHEDDSKENLDLANFLAEIQKSRDSLGNDQALSALFLSLANSQDLNCNICIIMICKLSLEIMKNQVNGSNFDSKTFQNSVSALLILFDQSQEACEALVTEADFQSSLKAFSKVGESKVSQQLLFRLLSFQLQTEKIPTATLKSAQDLTRQKIKSSNEFIYFLTLLSKKDSQSANELLKAFSGSNDMFDYSNEFFRFFTINKQADKSLFLTNSEQTCQSFLKVLKRDAKKGARELKAVKLLHSVLSFAKTQNKLESFSIEVEKQGLLDLIEGLQESEDEKVFEAAQSLLQDFFSE